jgi:hypothetical protein
MRQDSKNNWIPRNWGENGVKIHQKKTNKKCGAQNRWDSAPTALTDGLPLILLTSDYCDLFLKCVSYDISDLDYFSEGSLDVV